jgi:hypothetical protein
MVFIKRMAAYSSYIYFLVAYFDILSASRAVTDYVHASFIFDFFRLATTSNEGSVSWKLLDVEGVIVDCLIDDLLRSAHIYSLPTK